MTAAEPGDLPGTTSPPAAPGAGDGPAGSVEPESVSASGPKAGAGRPGRARLIKAIVVYTVLRFALIAALTAVLLPFVPLLIALVLAIVVQLPLSFLLFRRPRAELTAALAQTNRQRRAERANLRAQLRGSD